MKIYLVRHGCVDHNLLKLYNSEDEDLNEIGIKQAENIRGKIKSIHYDIIITSPLIRAKNTAELININSKKIIINNKLKERDPGSLNGKSFDLTNREEYWNYYTTIQYGTSENIKLFFKRIFEFIEDLKKESYHNIIIVAHSGVSKAFEAYFNGIGDGKFLNRGLKNCEIREYDLNN